MSEFCGENGNRSSDNKYVRLVLVMGSKLTGSEIFCSGGTLIVCMVEAQLK